MKPKKRQKIKGGVAAVAIEAPARLAIEPPPPTVTSSALFTTMDLETHPVSPSDMLQVPSATGSSPLPPSPAEASPSTSNPFKMFQLGTDIVIDIPRERFSSK